MSAEPSRRLTHMEAIIEAIALSMREDPRVFYIGQDVGAMQGSMQGTKGLFVSTGCKGARKVDVTFTDETGASSNVSARAGQC